MSKLREMAADELNAVNGGCRTLPVINPIDAARAQIGPAFPDTSTNPGPTSVALPFTATELRLR